MTQMSGSVSLDMRRLVEAVRTTVRDELAYPVLLTPEDTSRVLWNHADGDSMTDDQATRLSERLKNAGYALTAVRTDVRDWYADRYEAQPEPETIAVHGVPGVNLDAVHVENQAALSNGYETTP